MKFLFLLLFLIPTLVFAEPSPTLIGGTPAPAGAWPASVYASMNGARCTATVVGPRTLAIAAHCVSNGGTASFTAGGDRYSSVCTHSANYRGNDTADYALCLINKEVTGIKYESLLMDGSKMKVGATVKLTGYGCVRPGGGGGNDGIYRIGNARVTRLPSGTNNDVVTSAAPAALCYGDSGGPAVLEESGGIRWVFGVNSRGNIANVSYLSAWYTTQAKRFITSWQAKNDQKICGVDDDASGCRNDKGVEIVEFELKKDGSHSCKVVVKPGELKAEVVKENLIKAGF